MSIDSKKTTYLEDIIKRFKFDLEMGRFNNVTSSIINTISFTMDTETESIIFQEILKKLGYKLLLDTSAIQSLVPEYKKEVRTVDFITIYSNFRYYDITHKKRIGSYVYDFKRNQLPDYIKEYIERTQL